MLFTESLQDLVNTRYGCFLLECREDEERQTDFPSKDASSSLLETTASFTDGPILTEI